MASPRTRRVLKELRVRDDNNVGLPFFPFNRRASNAGRTTHNGFVRSTTMDKWKDLELEKMKVSGNRPAKSFMDAHGGLPGGFQEKWNSKPAALYRDKVSAMAEGRSWDESSSPAQNWSSPLMGSTAHGLKHNSYSYSAMPGTPGAGGRHGDDNYQKDNYFDDHGMGGVRNDRGYQGGNKYQGFGNTVDEDPNANSDMLSGAMSTLSTGWSSVSRYAASAKDVAAARATELAGTMKHSASTQGGFLSSVGSSLGSVTSKATEMGYRGWSDLSSKASGYLSPSTESAPAKGGWFGGGSRSESYQKFDENNGGFGGFQQAPSPQGENRGWGDSSMSYHQTSDNRDYGYDANPTSLDQFSIPKDTQSRARSATKSSEDEMSSGEKSTKKSSKKSSKTEKVDKSERKSASSSSKSKSSKKVPESSLIDFDELDESNKSPEMKSKSKSKPAPAAASNNWDDDAWDLLNK